MSHRAELSIAVRKRYWGQGIGSMLMKELIQYAKENGIEIINLDVRKDNDHATRLYEKFGFMAYWNITGIFQNKGRVHRLCCYVS